MASIGLAASVGAGTSRLQRPSIRAGATTRHPILSTSFDDNWKACRRRPHLSDGFFARPGSLTGASTSTKDEAALSTAIPLTPL
jgi:hypothetical protein